MPEVVFRNCRVSVDSTNGGLVLDPCNCTSYFEISTSDFGSEHSRTRLYCEDTYLWHFRHRRCEPADNVLREGVCDLTSPWNRCIGLKIGDRNRIRRTCILEGSYIPQESDRSVLRMDTARYLPREAQMANLELAFASLVAGAVITLVLVAIVLTFCKLPQIRLPRKVWFSKLNRQKSPSAPGNVTEGDNISVVYEDVDDDEGESGQTVPKQLAFTSHSKTYDSGQVKETSRTTVVTTTTRVTSPANNNPGPSFNLPSSQDNKKPKLLPHPPGSTPKVPNKFGKPKNGQDSIVTTAAKRPLRPVPPKPHSAPKSGGYIHPS